MVDLEEFTLDKAKSMNINELRKIDTLLSRDIRNQNKKWSNYLEKHPQSPLPNSLGHYDEYDRSNIDELLENDINLQKLNSKYGRRSKTDLYLRIKRKQEYVNEETFTIKGFENVKRNVRQRLKDLTGYNVRYTNKLVDIYWKAYNELTGHSEKIEPRISINKRRQLLKNSGYSSQYDSNNFQAYLYDMFVRYKENIKDYEDLLNVVLENVIDVSNDDDVTNTISQFFR